jgi:hypothetical protein
MPLVTKRGFSPCKKALFMYPFHALPDPALPDGHRYAPGFGPLPLDTLPIVIRSIAPDDRTSLLNLALVNKSAYFATRQRRRALTLVTESGNGRWRSSDVHELRRFRHSLRIARDAHPTVPDGAPHALLSHWIRWLSVPRKFMYGFAVPLLPRPMLMDLLKAVLLLPMPEQSELLWKLLLAQDMPDRFQGCACDGRPDLLGQMMKKADCLPDEQGQAFALACRIARWRYDDIDPDGASKVDSASAQGDEWVLSPTSLKAACEQILLDPGALPLAAQALALDVIVSHLKILPTEPRERTILDILAAIDKWPALARARILAKLIREHSTVSELVADSVICQLYDLDSMLAECAALEDDDRLQLLEHLVYLIEHRNTPCAHCSDEEANVRNLRVMASYIGGELITQLIALPYSDARRHRLQATLKQTMQACYGWDQVWAKWMDGFLAVCAANKRLHGVSYGVPRAWLGLTLFQHDDRDRNREIRVAFETLLKKGKSLIGSSDEVATWRLFLDIIDEKIFNEDGGRSLFRQERSIARDTANALLAEPEIMTPVAWVELMLLNVDELSGREEDVDIVRRIVQSADALPDALRARLIAHVARKIFRLGARDPSGVSDLLPKMLKALGDRDKAFLLRDLISILWLNSGVKLWLPEITRIFDGLPDPLKASLLEELLDADEVARSDAAACARLLPELERQIATLPTQPQACLLLSLALCLGQCHESFAESMLEGVMSRLDKLDLPSDLKRVWRLLYRAAYLYPRDKERNAAQSKQLDDEVEALPDSLRQMLNDIGSLPRHEIQMAASTSGDNIVS